MPGWYRAAGDGITLSVRLTPKCGQDEIEGVRTLADGTSVLAARVRAAPEKGAANAALEKLIARSLGVAATKVSVAAGHKARVKRVHVAGDRDAIAETLSAIETLPGGRGEDERTDH